jgi:hypothetical protein
VVCPGEGGLMKLWRIALWVLRVSAAGWVAWLYLVPPTVATSEGVTVSCSPLQGGARYDLWTSNTDESEAVHSVIDIEGGYGAGFYDRVNSMYRELDRACDVARDDRSMAIYLVVAILILSFVIRGPWASRPGGPRGRGSDSPDVPRTVE